MGSLVFVVFQKEPMHRTFQQNVRGQIDVFFPDPSKYDLAPQKQKHWALDKPNIKKPVSQIKVEPAPEIEEKEPEKFEKEMQTSPEPPKTKGKTKKGKVKTFTDTHGMVPDIYVPAWKTNVPHRDHLLEIAELTDTNNSTPNDSLFLNKRERLEKNLNKTYPKRIFNYSNVSHLSKYNAFLRYRK